MGQGNMNNMQNNNFGNNMNMNPMNNNNQNNNMNNKGFSRKKHTPQLDMSILCSIINEGQSIDKNEINAIKSIIQVNYSNFDNNQNYLSDTIVEEIKNKLGGEWFVFICEDNNQSNIYFNISTVSDTDFLELKLGRTLFKIAKIK